MLDKVIAVETLAEPLTEFVPVTSPVKAIVLAVPQLAVVILAEPLKEVPFIVRAVFNVFALVAVPRLVPDYGLGVWRSSRPDQRPVAMFWG